MVTQQSPTRLLLVLVALTYPGHLALAADQPLDRPNKDCIQDRPSPGDFGQFSVGPSVSAQVLKYNFGSKQASFNTGLGAGVSIRYYRQTFITTEKNKNADLNADEKSNVEKYATTETDNAKRETSYYMPLGHIKSACRATSTDLGQANKLATSLVSLTPTLYASKPDAKSGDIALQPAILLGFLNDVANIGVGWNLTGPETGKVFLLFSLGYGFKF
jgi:hypothetical protein